MKELTIEEKAKRYDDAIEKARVYWETDNDNTLDIKAKGTIEYLFPELKGGEDERIRKALIRFHKSSTDIDGIKGEDVIAWLEKQGEHANFRNNIQVGDKVTRNEAGVLVNISQLNRIAKPRMTKPADKVEPKFHEGEWITNGDYTWKIVEIKPLYYILQSQNGEIVDDTKSYVNGQFHSFTIQDAKDGDVLIDKSGSRECPFIFKETKPSDIKTDVPNPLTILGYCGIGGAGFTKGSGWGDTANCIYYPATKKQRDTLERAITNAGYEWNAEKKELRKLSHSKVTKISDQVQKPAESTQETKPNGGIVSEDFNEGDGSYKVNLAYMSKPQVELIENLVDSWQNHANNSVEWSEEDIRNIENIDSVLFYDKDLPEDTCMRLRNWLKSLKERIGGLKRK